MHLPIQVRRSSGAHYNRRLARGHFPCPLALLARSGRLIKYQTSRVATRNIRTLTLFIPRYDFSPPQRPHSCCFDCRLLVPSFPARHYSIPIGSLCGGDSPTTVRLADVGWYRPPLFLCGSLGRECLAQLQLPGTCTVIASLRLNLEIFTEEKLVKVSLDPDMNQCHLLCYSVEHFRNTLRLLL